MPFGVNGQELQHALINLQASTTGAPFQFARFKSVKYEDAAEKAGVSDSQGQQVSFTIKEQKTDGSITMLLSEWFRWRDWLRNEAAQMQAILQRPVGIGQVSFNMTIQYGATLATLKTDVLTGVMIQKEPRDSSDNQEALQVEIPLFILGIGDNQGNRFVQY